MISRRPRPASPRVAVIAAAMAALTMGTGACGLHRSDTRSAGATTAAPSTISKAAATTSTDDATTTTASTTGTPSPTSSTPPPTSVASPTTTTTPSTTTTTTTIEPLPHPDLPATNAVFDTLARANPAVSMTVIRDGVTVASRASGSTIDGSPATGDSPMVVASVSKLVTATAIARLAEAGLVDLRAPMPWARIGMIPNPEWNDVTVRELLDHTSGMPVARAAWFTGEGDCASFLPSLLTQPPTDRRGRWTYSNGNYCALGLLVSAVTEEPLDVAVQRLVFDPVEQRGLHLTTDGQQPGDIAYRLGVERLSRLGGAGTFLVSADDLAVMLSATTPADRVTLSWPAVMLDQYGWGHTGTVDGAKACAWTLEFGRTAIVTTVAGNSPSTGGGVCDRVVPALADDLDLDVAGPPDRTPP